MNSMFLEYLDLFNSDSTLIGSNKIHYYDKLVDIKALVDDKNGVKTLV